MGFNSGFKGLSIEQKNVSGGTHKWLDIFKTNGTLVVNFY